MNVILWIISLITGFLASLGVGGGMILILFLTVFYGKEQLTAQGINLLFFLPIALLSVIIHAKNGLISKNNTLPAIAFGVLTAIAGAFIAEQIGSSALRKIFAVFVILIGIKELLYKAKKE